ncbi:MAG: hypothetical protein K2Y37_15080 [Pirellulales bacterium]|nr:hypothetical protein [Pirellulales bacterium]
MMSKRTSGARQWRGLLGSLGLLAVVTCTGCQIEVGGQTLPSAYYQMDDVQYFAPGSEFKLSREAAALKAARLAEREELERNRQR